ncbi:MAG: hypothetical protein EP330_13385 [Deltaproteobacteria bacterium]|nr:MAG: hypothetical protein EP330_13385 [Deltaproteobacteria bacterium]
MWAVEVWNRYLNWMPDYLPAIVGGAVVAGALVWAAPRLKSRESQLGWGVTGVVLAVGLWQAWVRMSVVDDAFISLRYAKNLLAGRGFVFNEGEYVLGITNFGWTLLMAALSAVTTLELPHVALLMATCGYVALVLGTRRASLAMHGDAVPPLAVLGVGLSWLTHSFATTGLESLSVVALVILALGAVVREEWKLAGLFLTVAALFRLDHGLFLVVGGLLALREGKLKDFLLATPLLAAMLGFCAWYYGSPIPNTALNKASGGAYWSNGAHYLWTFLLTTHLLWLLPLALFGAVKARDAAERRGANFALGGLVLWPLYIGYVGGDFMIGRFLLVVIPLVFLLAETGVRHLRGSKRLTAAVAMGATFYGLPIIHRKAVEWWVTDEGSIYEVKTLVPFAMKHHTAAIGQFLQTHFVERGYTPTIAAHGIGMIGYYSDLPIVDIIGLTDPVTATMKLDKRGRPGHERYAGWEHLQGTGAILTSLPPFPQHKDITRLHVPIDMGLAMSHWHVLRYEPAVMDELREKVPELKFLDIEEWLDGFVANLDAKPTVLVHDRLWMLDRFYFNQPGAKLHYQAALRKELAEREERERLEAIGYVAGEDQATGPAGVVVHEDAAIGGLNLIASAHGPEALLVDMQGAIVHRWWLPFDKAFPGEEVPHGTGGSTWRRVRALDNGDLLAIFEGQGIVRMTRDSELVWAVRNRAHHEIELTGDGTLWTLTRRIRRDTPFGRALVEDFAVELDLATGAERQRISLLDAVANSPARGDLEALLAPGGATEPIRKQEVASGDVLHVNAVKWVEADAGPLKRGQLLLSSRVLSQLWALDPATGAITWRAEGAFDGQHDPWLLDDGTVLLFDNGLKRSRAMRVDADGREVWSWTRPGFFSRFCGAVQPLADGQVLITESNPGRAVQVDAEGHVLWELHSPWRAVDDPTLTATLYAVVRLPADYGRDWLTAPGSATAP